MINNIIQDVFVNFTESNFINNEMKNILQCFARKKEYAYLIKPNSIAALAQHPAQLLEAMPMLESISKQYLNK